jgi:hypothetical protein
MTTPYRYSNSGRRLVRVQKPWWQPNWEMLILGIALGTIIRVLWMVQ